MQNKVLIIIFYYTISFPTKSNNSKKWLKIHLKCTRAAEATEYLSSTVCPRSSDQSYVLCVQELVTHLMYCVSKK